MRRSPAVPILCGAAVAVALLRWWPWLLTDPRFWVAYFATLAVFLILLKIVKSGK